MSTDYSPRSGGSSRRGRRRGGRRSGPRSEYSSHTEKKPEGFLAKVQSFFSKTFGGKKTAKPASSYSSSSSSPSHTNGSRPKSEPKPSIPRSTPSVPKAALEEPNPDLVTGPRLYVGNLSYDTAESDLFDLFSTVGGVRNVELVMDRRANRSKGFGFVEMNALDIAKQAVMKLHRTEFMGRQIVVSGAKSERREVEPEETRQETI
jgi:RNA recognition motif-containing protein